MAYHSERLKNGLAYIATIHKHISNYDVYQTRMYKYLALIDFEQIKRVGKPIFNLDYVALRKGPVPKELYDNKEEYIKKQPFEDLLRLERSGSSIRYILLAEPDLQYFSNNEIRLIEDIVEKYAKPDLSVDKLCAITHQEIQAWRTAWENRGTRERVPMNPLDTFPGILEKDFDDLSPIEETALMILHPQH